MLNEIMHTRPTARAGGSAKSKQHNHGFAAKRQAVWLNGAFSTDACYKASVSLASQRKNYRPMDMASMNEQEKAFADFAPEFYSRVKDFPDFRLSPPLDDAAIAELENLHGFILPKELKELFKISSAIHMNGLSLDADKMGGILLPDSEALVIGYFYLYNAADRLLLRAGDPAIFYLEQHNGAITKLADNARDFLEKCLPRYL